MTAFPDPFQRFTPPAPAGRQGTHQEWWCTCAILKPTGRDYDRYLIRDWRERIYHERVHHDAVAPRLRALRLKAVEENNRRHSVVKTVLDLRGVAKGQGSFIVLSGPSIVENARTIHPRQSDTVIAVNRAFTYYRSDYWLVGDPVVTPGVALSWLKRFPVPKKLVATRWVSPELVDMVGLENVYWFRLGGSDPDDYGIDPEIPELDYVYNYGTCTQHLADLMGASEQVYVGADCALTGLQLWPGEPLSFDPRQHHLVVADINGRMTVTWKELWATACYFEGHAWLLHKRHGVRSINLTGAGILGRYFERRRP